MFDRKIYFDAVRSSLFNGALNQTQVDGQNIILDRWELDAPSLDLRKLAYMLATTKHETASTMWPIEEYGKGEGHSYGERDAETGQTYYGRGFVQLTWRDNYARATDKLELRGDDDLEWHADRALDPEIATDVMFGGMGEGWFTGKKLGDYFSGTRDDPVGARQIINPDDKGPLVAGYHADFLAALKAATEAPAPKPPAPGEIVVQVAITAPPGVRVNVRVEEAPS
jgi:putative chitinase